MDKLNETMSEILEELKNLEVINITEIPDIDLYVDQLTTFMENKLQNYKRSSKDKIITKTMINNYTKNKVLPVPNKKKYSISQIAMLIMIYHMKPILSLNDISLLLKNDTSMEPLDFFEAFTRLQHNNKSAIEANIAEKIKEIKEINPSENDEKTILLLLAASLILEAGTNKLIVEKIIDYVGVNLQ